MHTPVPAIVVFRAGTLEVIDVWVIIIGDAGIPAEGLVVVNQIRPDPLVDEIVFGEKKRRKNPTNKASFPYSPNGFCPGFSLFIRELFWESLSWLLCCLFSLSSSTRPYVPTSRTSMDFLHNTTEVRIYGIGLG